LKNDKGRTNVLLLGIGGDGHDGPNLTDTMILASIDTKTGDVVLVNLPRDLWVGDINDKINAIYAFGQEKNKSGLASAETEVSKLLGVPVHYGFRIDFSGFTKAVDYVGGLDLTIDNTFTDARYPIEGKEDDLCGLTIETQDKNGLKVQVVKDATGSAIPLDQLNDFNDPFTCRYENLTFKAGPAHLDGIMALKFVRSRHGNNDEGSDFARSARQEKIIVAFREKVLSKKTLLDPKTILSLLQTFGASIDTDIGNDEIPLFSKLALKVDKANIRKVVLDASNDNSKLEVGQPASDFGGRFVLLPKNNNWAGLASFIEAELYQPPQPSPTPQTQK
jgi:LCP family protein required for cell wall assembly